VASRQQDSSSRASFPNDVASRRGTKDTVLSDQKLLYAVRRTDFGNQLHDLGVVETTISSDDEERILGTLGDGLKQCCNEILGVVLLLEDSDLLTQARAVGAVRTSSSTNSIANSRSWLLAIWDRVSSA
jgi:hypothetical protein